MSGYKIALKDGSTVTVATAARVTTDGSGTYLYDADDKQVASFADGQVNYAIPADAPVEEPPAE